MCVSILVAWLFIIFSLCGEPCLAFTQLKVSFQSMDSIIASIVSCGVNCGH